MLAYTGTTVENYRTCTIIENGKIYFMKARETRHQLKKLFYVGLLAYGAYWAVKAASKIPGHLPLVIEGNIIENIHYMGNSGEKNHFQLMVYGY